jgi:hypothetical protein
MTISVLWLIGVEWQYLLIRFSFFSNSGIIVIDLYILLEAFATLDVILVMKIHANCT